MTELAETSYKEISKFLIEELPSYSLVSLTPKTLAKISDRMLEIDRAINVTGRSDTQTTNQLMTLNMLSDSPYRSLRQCLAQIEDRKKALEQAYFKLRKNKAKITKFIKEGSELSLIKAEELESSNSSNILYIEGAIKELAIFQEAYEEIKETHNIPQDWDEKDLESQEITHHLRQAFKQAHRDIITNGSVSIGNLEYLEQFGVHPQTAIMVIKNYIEHEQSLIAEGKLPTIDSLYDFLNRMVELFSNEHHKVLKHLGLKEIIKTDYLYLENKDDN